MAAVAGPSLLEVRVATQTIVKNARKDNRLSKLTPRIIRQEVEQTLKLDAGTLDSKAYKDCVKDATDAVLADGDDLSDDLPIQKVSKPTAKGKKRKSEVEADEEDVMTAKKPKSAKKPKPALVEDKKAKKRPTPKDAVPRKVFKSADMIETSDEEEPEVASTSTHKATLQEPITKVQPPKQRHRTKVSSDKEPDSSPVSKAKSKAEHSGPDFQSGAAKKSDPSTLTLPHEPKDEDGNRSESEMSILIDATPIKRGTKKKEKAPANAKKPPKEKKAKKSTVELSKDEENIKRLKSFVHACGVRKVWAKELQSLDKPSQQIKRLKEILGELGMDGRPSMDKAKAIKAKRDLAQELQDVQSFEQAVVGGPSRKRSRAKSSAREEGAGSVSGGESEGGRSDFSAEAPIKHRNAARRSIMAFLGDDNDDE